MKFSAVMRASFFLFVLGLGIGLGSWGLKLDRAFKVFSPDSPSAFAVSSDLAGEIRTIFVQVSKKSNPTVVNIYTTSTVKTPWKTYEGGGDDLWRKFFDEFFGEPYGGEPGSRRSLPKAMSLGSGVVIETSNTGGLILTNNHVVDGADEIKIRFTEESDEKDSPAEIVGMDPELDVALLKVKTRRKLQAAVLGDSDKLEVGEWIAALGNPFGHGHSLTHGIVSAKERTLPGGFGKYLQVDAPINPGNSGGPLVNLNAEVVGLNNAIDARGPGIGFAIPINPVKAILAQLKEKGRVERGFIGINVDDLRPDLAKSLKLDEELKAPIITHVIPGNPADKAGLKAYDVIVAINGTAVHTPSELVAAITAVPIGKSAKVKILRNGKEKEVSLLVSSRPVKTERMKKSKTSKESGSAGISVEMIDEDVAHELGLPENYKGVVVAEVFPGSPSYRAGLVRGDVILEIDQKPVKTEEQFYNLVGKKKVYILRIRRQAEEGREMFLVITLDLSGSKKAQKAPSKIEEEEAN